MKIVSTVDAEIFPLRGSVLKGMRGSFITMCSGF